MQHSPPPQTIDGLTLCPLCEGRGNIHNHPCPRCGGSGYIDKADAKTITKKPRRNILPLLVLALLVLFSALILLLHPWSITTKTMANVTATHNAVTTRTAIAGATGTATVTGNGGGGGVVLNPTETPTDVNAPTTGPGNAPTQTPGGPTATTGSSPTDTPTSTPTPVLSISTNNITINCIINPHATVTIGNNGGGTLNWKATVPNNLLNLLQVSPSSGRLTAGRSQPMDVTALGLLPLGSGVTVSNADNPNSSNTINITCSN